MTEIQITQPPETGNLTYDRWIQHFSEIIRRELIVEGQIQGASNLGSGDGVYSSVSSHILKFKSLTAGTAITISTTSTEIEIACDISAVTDHGQLTGLDDDDHKHYILKNGTRALTGGWYAGAYDIRAGSFISDGNIIIADGKYIGQLNGPKITFDDTNNYLEITGCKVGIGLTDPSYKLTIYGGGTIALRAFYDGNASNYGELGSGSNGVYGKHYSSGNFGQVGLSASGVYGYSPSLIGVYGRSNTGTAGHFYSESGYGLIVEKGNVGIGITSPQIRLDVRPSARTTAYLAADLTTWSDVHIHNPSNTANSATGISFIVDSGYHINAGTGIGAVKGSGDFDADLVFITRPNAAAAAERMRITSDGNVGIGTTPNQKLTVEGTMSLKEQAAANADTAAYGQLWVKNTTPCELWFTRDDGTDVQVA